MAYHQYRSRCIGRLLFFLCNYHPAADECIFTPDKKPMITLYGKPYANYTWDGVSDVPTFEFLGAFKRLNDIQEIRKPKLLELFKT